MRQFVIFCSLFAAGLGLPQLTAHPIAAGEIALKNGDFQKWTDGEPEGWTVSVGARNSGVNPSSLERIEPDGLSLSGVADTGLWYSVSQSFALQPGRFYRVSYQARARDLKREGRQYDNCYIGILAKNTAGENVAMQFQMAFEPDWTEGSLSYRADPSAATAELLIFLSKTGSLNVRKLSVEILEASDSYDLLVEEMGRNYSYFAHKNIDWEKLAQKYRSRGLAANTPKEFIEVITELLGQLKDVHVTIQTDQGQRLPTHRRNWKPNYNFQAVAKKLKNTHQIDKIGFLGRGEGGIGYIAVTSLSGHRQMIDQFEQAFEKLLDAPGLIIDLRANGGGDERVAQKLVGRLTDKPVVYAKSQYRKSADIHEFTKMFDRVLQPQGNTAYQGPVICLIGPGCISSGEGMALMLKALPQVTVIGQPTAGASGNPAPLPLPNGVSVSFSRWLSLTPDGKLIEDVGVTPAETIDHRGSGDPTFEAAVKLLEGKIREASKS